MALSQAARISSFSRWEYRTYTGIENKTPNKAGPSSVFRKCPAVSPEAA
jgi:hypothetical protein